MKGKLIWVILAVAFLFRFVALTNFPTGFNADEASFGYDAYSILSTGSDQWGNVLPIVLKSFGDYKSPAYSYLAVPGVAVFGLNVFATRLPGVLIGTLAVLVIYLLLKKLTKSEILATVAAAALAINPWSVMISRGAFEFNLITLLIPLGILLFLEEKYSLSALIFGVNMFSYHSAKVITPVVIIGLIIIFRKKLAKLGIKKMVIPLTILAIFFVGMLYTFGVGGGSRIAERSITDGALEQGFTERMSAIAKGENTTISKIFHNKYQVIFTRFTDNYFQYFSYKFFFEKGAGDASYGMVPGIGVLNVFEGILLVGLFPLFFIDKKNKNLILIIVAWLLITPLPAALATGVGYSGNRASGMIPALQILEAFGFWGWYLLLKKCDKKLLYLSAAAFIVLMFFNTSTFVKSYFKTPSNTSLRQMDYGNLEVANWLENINSKKILVSRSLSEPQIFIAFENKWNPVDYQKATGNWDLKGNNVPWVDQLPFYSLGNYTFESIDWKNDTINTSYVVIRADEIKKGTVPIKTFYYPDGTPNIYVANLK